MKIENPVKLDEGTIKKLEEAFSMDCSIGEACLLANISSQTYYNWIESFPELKTRFEKLREHPILKARTTIIKGLDKDDNAKWYLERKAKKEFAQNKEAEKPNTVNFNFFASPKLVQATKEYEQRLKEIIIQSDEQIKQIPEAVEVIGGGNESDIGQTN